MSLFSARQKTVFALFLFIWINSLLTSEAAAVIDKFHVETRLSHKEACFQAYKNVAYSLWKHLCGMQSAGKREDLFEPAGSVSPLDLDKHQNSPNSGEVIDAMKKFLDSVSENKDEKLDAAYY